MDLCHDVSDFWPLRHPGRILAQGSPAVHQGDGRAKGQAELHVHHGDRVVLELFRRRDKADAGAEDAYFDLLDVLRSKVVRPSQVQQAVDWALIIAAAGVRLDAGLRNQIFVTEATKDLVGVRIAGIGVQEDGTTFVINDDTEFETSLRLGKKVEVDAIRSDGKLTAIAVDTP